MCACKETDVRESANDRTLASGEGHGSCGETCYETFDENPVSSLVVLTVDQVVVRCLKHKDHFARQCVTSARHEEMTVLACSRETSKGKSVISKIPLSGIA
jgi:hypothetical protein